MSAATIYADPNFTGASASLGYGKYPRINNLGINDNTISSVKVAPWTRVTLYEGYDYTGRSVVITGRKDIPQLSALPGSMNDQTSSLIVARMEPSDSVKANCCTGAVAAEDCGEYIPGSAACKTAMGQYCRNNMSDQRCKVWCQTNTDVCDSLVTGFCDANPSDPYCACVKSPAMDPNVGSINPLCVDDKCIRSGAYATTNMRQKPCSNIINCNTKIALQNAGVQLSTAIPIEQNCGGTGVGTSTTEVTGDSKTNLFTGTNILILFMFFVFLALLVSLGYSIREAMHPAAPRVV